VLADFGATADAKFAYAAATWWEPGNRVPEVVHVMVVGGARHSPNSSKDEIVHLLRILPVPGPSDVADRAVDEIGLPCGSAVRLRALMRAPGSEEGHVTVVLDTIQYWVPVPRRDEMIVLSGTTPSLGPRDDLAEIVATVARSLRFTYFEPTR
jgi:hypothetical protein